MIEMWKRVQERAVPVGITVLVACLFIALAGFPWIWLVGGAISLALLYPYLSKLSGTGASSPATIAPATAQSGTTMDLSRLQGHYLEMVQRALSTRRKIEGAVSDTPDPGQRSVLADSIEALPELTDNIYTLAQKAQSVQSGMGENPMEQLAEEIKQLESAIKGTSDEFQKSQYYASMDGKLQQMQNITDAMVALRRWDAQIGNAISTLDTLLSQVLRIKSSEVLSYTGSTDDLSSSLKREVDSLKAAAEAMDAVYGWQGKP